MPIGSQVIYNAGDLILSTVSSSGNTFLETKISAATSSVILFNNSASLTSASLNSLTVGNAISSSYALTASFALNAGGGSGTVSGSTNYIAKFISSTSVGTSSIYESGSNVGIGTTSPFSGAELDVWGDIVLMNQNWSIRGNNGNGDFAIEELSGSSFSDSNIKFYIASGGNVGIGTIVPTQKLEVHGNVQIGNDNVTNVGLKLTRLNGGFRTSEHTFHSSQNSPWYTYGQNLTWTNELAGTVEPTQAYRPYFEGFAPAVGYKVFGFMNVNTGSFTSANVINSLVLKNDGNVGIGTTNPAFLLDVSGSSRHGFTSTNTHQFTGSVNINGSLFSDANITASNISASRTGSFSIVGIGTTSPVDKLTIISGSTRIASTALAGALYFGSDASNIYLQRDNNYDLSLVQNGDSNSALYLASAGNVYVNIDSNNNDTDKAFIVQNNALKAGTELFRIQENGNVGIGTTSPTAKLHVYNGSSHFEATSNGNAAIVAGLYALQIGPLHDRDSTAGRYYGGIAFNHLLNFGGGTTYNGAPQAWIGTRLQDTTGSERDYLVFATKPGTGVSGTGNDIPIERMCIDRDGNVGIGTTVPTGSLHVNNSVANIPVLNLGGGIGGENVSDLYVLNSYNANTGVGFSAKVIGVNISGSLTAQNIPVQRTVWSGVTSATAIVLGADGPRQGTQDNAFQIWTTSEGTSGSLLTQKFSLTSTGDVGIGTTAPAFLLDVSGSSRHGYRAADTHQFTGSVSLSDGLSLTNLTASNISASGNIIASKITASNAFINGNLTVTGSIFASLFSASYIYITSSTLVVTDNILTLNALSPYQRYAGIEMYDSGSGNLSSFLWDGQGDYFFITGSGINSKVIGGPDGQANLTSGRLTKATGVNIIGDSIVYDYGNGIGVDGYVSASNITASNISASKTGSFGIVGINTSTPGYTLEVNGTQRTVGNFYLFNTVVNPASNFSNQKGAGFDATTGKFEVAASASTALSIGRYGSTGQLLDFRYAGTQIGNVGVDANDLTVQSARHLLLSPTNNVGIGTSSPSYKLHIYSGGIGVDRSNISSTAVTPILSVKMSGSSAVFNDIISIQNSTSADQSNLIIGHANGLGQSTFIGAGESATYASNLTGWGGEYLYLGADEGVVAVTNLQSGPAAAYYPFTISPNGSIRMQYQLSGSSWSGASDSYALNVSGSNTQGLLYLQSPTAQNALFVSGSGNVGIGTTTPIQKLHVVGSTLITNNNSHYGYTFAGAQSNLIGISSADNIMVGQSNVNHANTIIYGGLGVIDLNTSGSTRMRVTYDGNVGIGVTNPSGRLHITASATSAESLIYLSKGSGSISQNYINAVDQSGNLNYRVQSDINGHLAEILYQTGTSYVSFNTFWSSWINNNNYTQGGLGIGTTSQTHGYGVTIARPATSGSLYVSGSSVFTGSVGISGSVNLSGPIIYDNAVLMDFGRTTTPAISTNYVVLQNITGSYNAAFFDYFASSASNFRAGTVIAGWSGSSINYTEYSTTDIGNTNQLTMSVDLSSSFVRLLTTVSTTTNWNIKSSGRYL